MITFDQFEGHVPDLPYVEGSIELSLDGQPLLTRKDWDLLDQLWPYLLTGLSLLFQGIEFSIDFPEQIIVMTISPDTTGQTVNVTVRKEGYADTSTSVEADFREFMNAMLEAAAVFFERIAFCNPPHASLYRQYSEEVIPTPTPTPEQIKSGIRAAWLGVGFAALIILGLTGYSLSGLFINL